MRYLFAALLLPGVLSAAILPDAIGAHQRQSVGQPAITDRQVWDEYGLKSSETASYASGDSKFSATVWQLQDATASIAAFFWQRPAAAKPSPLSSLAAETKDSLLTVHGNYLLSFAGYKPSAEELDGVKASLNHVDAGSLPALIGYLPSEGLVPNSERYILGPAGLERFAPGIPPSVAAFRYAAEAQLGLFRQGNTTTKLTIFNYPTHQIAMDRMPEFEKIPGAVAKRSGPLVAVILSPPDPDFAERLLGLVRYKAEITRDEYVPTRRDNIGELILNVFVLIGILLVFSLVSGLAVGGVRALFRRGKTGLDAEAMISLHLEKR
jgi:hypothetical protein